MGFFIAVVIVLLVLIYFMVVVLRSVVASVNSKVNNYFLDNLEEYDKQFDAKLKSLNQMYEEHDNMSRTLRMLQNDINAHSVSPFYAPRPLPQEVYVPIARYVDNDFFEEYKIAKDKLLSIDKQEVIDNVMARVPYEGDIEEYRLTCVLLEKLDFDSMYHLCSSAPKVQLEVLEECLEEKEQILLQQYKDSLSLDDEFDAIEFLNFVRKRQTKQDPHVFVYVGENEADYTNEERNITCNVDSNICEGIKIVYQNKVYDYSIYKSRKKK